MKFGHRLTGTIRAYDDKGRGTFSVRLDPHSTQESAVAVPFSAVGDTVEATFVKREHGVKVARLERVEAPGPERVATRCPHAGVCGGCVWQHLAYPAQLTLKRDMINAAFTNAGHDERVEVVVPCDLPEPFHHRNRMDYAVGWNGEIGLKEYGSWNRYVDVRSCLLLSDEPGAILEQVRQWMRQHDLQPWDSKFYTGDIRYVVVREGKNTAERMVSVIVKDAARITEPMRDDLRVRLDALCTTILVGEQPKTTDLSLAERYEAVKGEPVIHEVVNGIRYRISPNSFFQTNTHMAAKLQDAVQRFVPEATASLLDLYCGLGFFGIFLASKRPELTVNGFEIDADAISLASQNAEANGVGDRCAFVSGPAEDLSWKDLPADTIILDPPRAGLHPRVVKTVLEKRPQTIVYVSCNYHRLVEELKAFTQMYRVESLEAFDLFPHTPHVEVVAKLIRV